ncbi:cell division protein FtsZ [bacterium]|nr:cell division protein FtsZ [bacterium]MBP5590307.1 cell division protein FtsZ [bacterium]
MISEKENPVKIAVVGVGGAGCNAVKMIEEEVQKNEQSVFKDQNVKVIAANTDAQVLAQIHELERIQLGPKLTKGQGAGGNPECGKDAAIESQVDIISAIEGYDMVFVTAGMGGGTGTGAAPVISGVAKKSGMLTVAIVTKPFSFEGDDKMESAAAGIEELRKNVDALLVIPNDTLIEMAGDDDDAVDMFKKTNEILINAVRNVSELIIKTGVINLDFSDVRNYVTDMGTAIISSGTATGENATLNAVRDALNNPLLKNFSIKGTKKMLAYVCGNTKLRELSEAAIYLQSLRAKVSKFKLGYFIEKDKTDVSVLIISEAAERDGDSVHQEAFERTEGAREWYGQNSDISEKRAEEPFIEVQKPAEINDEEKETISDSGDRDESRGLKPIPLVDEAIFIPENDIDQNDKSIPAILRKASKMESRKEREQLQISIEEYIGK